LQKLVVLMVANELELVTGYLSGEVGKLANAGASFGLLAANTPHVVFDEINHDSPIPLISIVQAACDAARVLALKKLGLFGTRFTMQGHFYSDVFSREAIALVIPNDEEQSDRHSSFGYNTDSCKRDCL